MVALKTIVRRGSSSGARGGRTLGEEARPRMLPRPASRDDHYLDALALRRAGCIAGSPPSEAPKGPMKLRWNSVRQVLLGGRRSFVGGICDGIIHNAVEHGALVDEPFTQGGDGDVVTHVDRDGFVAAGANRPRRKAQAACLHREPQALAHAPIAPAERRRRTDTTARAGNENGTAVTAHGRSIGTAIAAGRKLRSVRSWTAPGTGWLAIVVARCCNGDGPVSTSTQYDCDGGRSRTA